MSPASAAYGQIVTGADVESWVIEHLKTWSLAYLAEMERQTSRAAQSLPAIRGYTRKNRLEKWPEDQLPLIIVESPGLAERGVSEGDGKLNARWRIGVAAVCSADTEQNAKDLARVYAAALRAALLQHPSLSRDEVQTIAISGATGGTFTLTWNGETTSALAHNASASTVLAALEALSNIAPGDVLVSGGPLGATLRVTFTGALGRADQPQISVSGSGLTGPSPQVTIATVQAGVPARARHVEWVEERYDALPDLDEERTMALGAGIFNIEVADVTDRRGGLSQPPADPYAVPPGPPSIATTNVEVKRT